MLFTLIYCNIVVFLLQYLTNVNILDLSFCTLFPKFTPTYLISLEIVVSQIRIIIYTKLNVCEQILRVCIDCLLDCF